MKPPFLSAVLIAKDEERLIGRSIRSLAGVDEVVVLDTGSKDGTMEAAGALGAAVRRMDPAPEPFHFAEARNRALEHARHDWILTIDADEVLRPGGLAKIRAAMDFGKVTALKVTYLNRTERGDRTFTTWKPKVFRKDRWTWKYRVHEQLVPKDGPATAGNLGGVVFEHLPGPEPAHRRGQNLELLELCVKESPEYAAAKRLLGQELMLLKRWEEALPWLRRYVEGPDEGPLETAQTLMLVGMCLGALGRVDEALEWFGRSASAMRRREPLYEAALVLIKACRLEDAIDWIERMRAVPTSARPDSPYDLPGIWGDLEALRMLAFCRTEIERAKATWEKRPR
jgi:hypothetical protein